MISAIHWHMHACWTKVYLGMNLSLLKRSRFVQENTALKPLCSEINLYKERNSHCANKYSGHEMWKNSLKFIITTQIFPHVYFWNLHSMSNAAHSKSIKYYAVLSEVIFTEMNDYVAKQEHKNPYKKPLWNKCI